MSIALPLPIHPRRLAVIESAEKTRRLLGFHLRTTESTRSSSATIFYVSFHDQVIPIACLAAARSNPTGFEVLIGRASGVPSTLNETFTVSERGVDVPVGESISLWSTHVTGEFTIELMWC